VPDPAVWVFFYGSYINVDVLGEVDLVPARIEVARLSGYDIHIAPLANLVPSAEHAVYGILATATHPELRRLYTEHAQKILGGIYEPQAVLAEDGDGRWRPALCYLAHNMATAPAAPEYVQRISVAARRLGFPAWYCARIGSFAAS